MTDTELSVKERKNGIHTLIVFSSEWIDSKYNKDDINTFLDSDFFGTSNRENENTRCKFDLAGVINHLDKFKKYYFIIFTHVDNRTVQFKECERGLIKSLFNSKKIRRRVLGLQKSEQIESSEVDRDYKKKIISYYMGSGGIAELKIVDKYNKKYTITKHFSDNTTYITDEFDEPKK